MMIILEIITHLIVATLLYAGVTFFILLGDITKCRKKINTSRTVITIAIVVAVQLMITHFW